MRQDVQSNAHMRADDPLDTIVFSLQVNSSDRLVAHPG